MTQHTDPEVRELGTVPAPEQPIRLDPMPRFYIAGPMSGLPQLNFPAFHAAAATLRAQGLDVVNPAEVNVEPGTPWADCMRADIPELLKCDAIALLPGWEKSRGARLEAHIAEELGMPAIPVDRLIGHTPEQIAQVMRECRGVAC